jgi:hypothetical protein
MEAADWSPISVMSFTVEKFAADQRRLSWRCPAPPGRQSL